MEKTKNKPFEDWLYEDVEQFFGLTRLRTKPILQELNKLTPVPKEQTIEYLRLSLFDYVDTWNEDELKFMFISPFINLVRYNSEKYKIFTQRMLSIQYDNDSQTTSGRVEFMLAQGKQTPKKPFFFLHEYKQENRRDNDPLGQLLIAMVAAQIQNADDETLYGCYVSGRNWFFVVLEDKEYAVSNAYNAADDDIYQIFAILLWFKEQCNERFKLKN